MKAGDSLTTLSQTVLPIGTALVGALMFVYSQVYVAQVQVKTPRNYNKIEVHVFNDKGNELVFHNDKFQLQPDHYRFEISVDESPIVKDDKQVNFGDKVTIVCNVPPPNTTAKTDSGTPAATPKTATAAAPMKNFFPAASGTSHVALASATTMAKTPDPAAARQQEAIDLATLCVAERHLRNLPITAADPRLQTLLNQMSPIQNAINAHDAGKLASLIPSFNTNVYNLQSQLASGGPVTASVGTIKGLPPFVAMENLIFSRLDEILGLDAPTRVGPCLPQRVKIVFALRAAEHQGKDVSPQRKEYTNMDEFLSKLKTITPDVFQRTEGEVKSLAGQLNIADMPELPPPPPAFTFPKTSPGSSPVAQSSGGGISPAAPTQANGGAVPPAYTEAINLAKLCSTVRMMEHLPMTPDDPRVQSLLGQLGQIQGALSAPNKAKAYSMIAAFNKAAQDLHGQAQGKGDALKNLPQLTAMEDLVFNRFNQIFGADAPARNGTFLVPRTMIVVRLRTLEGQGKDMSAQRQEYTQMNDFLSRQTTISPAVGKQIQPQVKDLNNQLGMSQVGMN